MKKIILAVIALALGGCAVYPYPISVRSEVRFHPAPLPHYSIYDRAYYWDPMLSQHFYWDNGYRVYMPRGWVRYYHR